MDRRNFIKTTTSGIAGAALGSKLMASSLPAASAHKRPIHVFTKCLQFLDYDQMAAVVAENGFDGADLTVRPNGQVLPENVEQNLPKAMKSLQHAGIGTNMITTAINDADDPFTRPILKTMAELGIRYYRMGYLEYDPDKSIPASLDHYKSTFEKLEKLNKEFGVTGNYQNHSGVNVGASVWDLYHILKDCDPEFIGVQYDIRHATAEGGFSWPLGLKLLGSWIRTIDIKDFIWYKNEKGEWNIKDVPLGEGMVDFGKYLELYKSLNIEAPVSIHYEYDLGGAEHGDKNPTMSLAEINKWLKKDITFFKDEFNKYGLLT
jgi:L-ribulose-5-phosphate 3-epimerase